MGHDLLSLAVEGTAADALCELPDQRGKIAVVSENPEGLIVLGRVISRVSLSSRLTMPMT